MKNQSTKSWSVVVPVSGRYWLNARHALRNSSEGLYLKKKKCMFQSPCWWERLFSSFTSILSSSNWATSQDKGIPQKYGVNTVSWWWGVASELLWSVSSAHCPFYCTYFYHSLGAYFVADTTVGIVHTVPHPVLRSHLWGCCYLHFTDEVAEVTTT